MPAVGYDPTPPARRAGILPLNYAGIKIQGEESNLCSSWSKQDVLTNKDYPGISPPRFELGLRSSQDRVHPPHSGDKVGEAGVEPTPRGPKPRGLTAFLFPESAATEARTRTCPVKSGRCCHSHSGGAVCVGIEPTTLRLEGAAVRPARRPKWKWPGSNRRFSVANAASCHWTTPP